MLKKKKKQEKRREKIRNLTAEINKIEKNCVRKDQGDKRTVV
jgi:hypothetical protein